MTPTSGDPDPSIAGAPINCLPEELLVTIFESALKADEYVDQRPTSRSRTALILVSKDWCRLIYRTPSFWTTIDSNLSGAQLDLALQNSNQAPLDIRFGDLDFSVGSGPAFEKVCRHIHRWRTANIPISFGRPWIHMTKPAPLLEDFALIGPAIEGEVPVRDLFQGQTPRLKSFRLIRYAIPWAGGLFSGLTTLGLTEITGPSPKVGELINILRWCPDLEDLTLDSILIRPIEALVDPIHLPRLRKLRISLLPIPITRDLLSVIQCLPCQSFSLLCLLDRDATEEDLAQLSRFPHFLPPTPVNEPAELLVGAGFLYYTIGPPPHSFEIQIAHLPISALVRNIIPQFPQPYFSLETELILTRDTSGLAFINSSPIVDVVQAVNMNITRVTINIREYGAALFLQRLGEVVDGRWNLPNLRELTVDLRGVYLANLVEVSKARYGIEPRRSGSEVPVPLTRLTVTEHLEYDQAGLDEVRDIVGAGCLVLEDYEY